MALARQRIVVSSVFQMRLHLVVITERGKLVLEKYFNSKLTAISKGKASQQTNFINVE
jgi:hypothetical protein